MLEDIRIKLMNQLREREESARLWATSFSPHSMKLYNEYLKVANRCFVNSNGEFGYEVREDGDTHTVNMPMKRCTCRGWDLTGIPCPHAIKAIQYKKMDPLEEINWWYSKEAYMLTYKHKLQPVRGENFWKVEESQAMKPSELVKLAGRPKVKRTREKDEAIKRQGEWGVSRKGRVMTCSNCGEIKHNARGCDKPPNKEKRQRMLDKEEEVGQYPQEEINLTAPQCSQASQGPEFVFMPTPRVYRETSSCATAFEHPELEDEPAIRPMVVSEEKTRLQQRQQPSQPSGSRVIAFKGDHNGLSVPSNLPYSPGSLTWNGKAAITGIQLQIQSRQRIGKLVPRKRNKYVV